MASSKTVTFCQEILSQAGITVGGSAPGDILVHNDEFYGRVLAEGALGLGESYMDRWWDCEHLDEFIFRVVRNDLKKNVKLNWSMFSLLVREKLLNRQREKGPVKLVGSRHYETGNDLFQVMLDKRMTYTCGYWEGTDDLGQAQENKLDLVCRKIGLEPGMKVLDLGCGWGSFAKFAAEKYHVSVLGVSLAREQVALGQKMCEGLPVEIRFQDYRDVEGTFDRIVSIGMLEEVGPSNYRTLMQLIHDRMVDDGLCLLHTIGANLPNKKPDAWTDKYIFPGGVLPTISLLSASMEGLLMVEDWHNIGINYEKTLLAWHANFEAGWTKLEAKYGDRFYRMWRYYLLSMAGAFRARSNQLWQIVMSKKGVLGGYRAIR